MMEYSSLVLFWILLFTSCIEVTPSSQPEQIHIAYGSSKDSMVIMWATHDQVTGIVQYGNASTNLLWSTGSDVTKMADGDFKAAKYVHRAEVLNLTAGETYYYRVSSLDVRDGTFVNTSETFNFKTPPVKQANVVKFLVYGDLGADDRFPTYGQLEKHVATGDYAAILHVGDMAYDMHWDNGKRGDKFLNMIQPFAARVPYMTCPGNHEKPLDFRHYRVRFSTPGTPWPIPMDKMWYSFDVGLVHFISYSTEVLILPYSNYACTQFDWLLNDLTVANQNRDKRPWIIAIGHRPMYCSNDNSKDCTGGFINHKVQHGLEALFHAQGVDLIIQAHEHSYERLWPMYKGKVTSQSYTNPRAPTHVISGAAGSEEGVDRMDTDHVHQWSAFRAGLSSQYSFGILEIHNNSHLYFEQINAEDEHQIDHFWLVQNNHGPFVPNVKCSGTGKRKHSSCFCPFPYFYIAKIVVIVLVASACVTLVIIGVCCYRKNKQKYLVLPSVAPDDIRHFDNPTDFRKTESSSENISTFDNTCYVSPTYTDFSDIHQTFESPSNVQNTIDITAEVHQTYKSHSDIHKTFQSSVDAHVSLDKQFYMQQ